MYSDPGANRAKKNNTKKQNSVLKYRPNMAVFFLFFFVHSKFHGAPVDIGLVWPRVKCANC